MNRRNAQFLPKVDISDDATSSGVRTKPPIPRPDLEFVVVSSHWRVSQKFTCPSIEKAAAYVKKRYGDIPGEVVLFKLTRINWKDSK